MENKRTEYISMQVTEEVAEAIKQLDSGDTKQKVLMGYIDECKVEIRESVELMDEDVLIFRGSLAKAKAAYREARDEYLAATYKLWEDSDKNLPKLKEQTGKLVNQLKPLKDELAEINTVLKAIHTFDIERFIKFIKYFNSNIYGETENILKYLMNNYKKDEKGT